MNNTLRGWGGRGFAVVSPWDHRGFAVGLPWVRRMGSPCGDHGAAPGRRKITAGSPGGRRGAPVASPRGRRGGSP
eukprot:11176531-Lingulodinium_polyedra.AAC.1